MITAVAARELLRRRRVVIAGAASVIAGGWSVVMAVVVVAMGGTPAPAELAASLGMPTVVVDAYQRAASSSTGVDCGMRWQVLAGIGRVETDHAAGHTVNENGTVTPSILGPILDGRESTAVVVDTDGGERDGDTNFDRAVGPMQFLPSSWDLFGADGNADGVADPNNIYDAALAATRHLCGEAGVRMDDHDALVVALRSYNHSDAYVHEVLDWVHYYDQAALAGPAAGTPTGSIVDVRGIRVDESLAPNLEQLLTAADDAGLALSGGGFRTRAEQIALRRAHCGTSDYAVYEMPANQCTPPTARPGESMHETGLAIDFTCAGVLVAHGDACFDFLAANGASYGLFNLPTEPWHWSTTGR